ncbi:MULTISPECIES: hypothetical protein [unclassified Rhizobium]|uniref:hypothetical protein n=1 Tax=unclassified Rhizobium TaxID=2613769 RepID=UPI000713F7F4|nr:MULTISPECIES: hypothetical protein [unclassified Rhizobium]KQS98079.1 hypothetical protein ASG50_23135 [Rhizobium sp. Leaf386]KQT00340.1 hypothetical protein ASG42_05725 [Rhizobium sp. Leaf391]KQT97343.1 hypothetical protein ASG68_10455 [Rhizobium sp. Leaf453]
MINAISARFSIGKLEIEKAESKKIEESIRFKFDSIVNFLTKTSYSSIYILIDRVDELTFTANDAERAFQFLESILIDLPLLETQGVAFKFFLWDQTKEYYQSAGGRPDRLIEYSLDWSAAELEKVLSRRIETYSDGKVSRFDELLSGDANYDVHKMLAHFAHGSPRDLIRISKKIVDEHTRAGSFGEKIPFRTVKSGIIAFSVERARELYGAQMAELKKVHALNFTISILASEIFRISGQAARAKAQKWQNSGAVIKIGEVPNPGNRPQYLYGIVDPRLAVAVMSDSSIEEALEQYLLLCPHCKNLRIAYEGEITCPDCQGNFNAEDATTLGTYCAVEVK